MIGIKILIVKNSSMVKVGQEITLEIEGFDGEVPYGYTGNQRIVYVTQGGRGLQPENVVNVLITQRLTGRGRNHNGYNASVCERSPSP